MAVLGLSGPAAPSLSCVTSKHHPNNAPLSPAGQHWPTRDPGPSWCQGKSAALASASALPCPAWQRKTVPCQIWGLEGGPRFISFFTFNFHWAGGRDIWSGPPPGSRYQDMPVTKVAGWGGRADAVCSSQGDPGEPGSGIRVSTHILPASTHLAVQNHPASPESASPTPTHLPG